jgi:threonine synthase
VKAASGVHPALPAHLGDLMERKELFTRLPNAQGEVERFIRSQARAVRGAVA